jgi:hypothetical protein
MMRAILTRSAESTDEGTFGDLQVNDGLRLSVWKTGELPDRGNAPGLSCIPLGTYLCKKLYSPAHKRDVYHVMAVPGRTDVELHPANVMGDKEKGFQSQLLGCIALGKDTAIFHRGVVLSAGGAPLEKDQRGLTDSAASVAAFERLMGGQDFELEIRAA